MYEIGPRAKKIAHTWPWRTNHSESLTVLFSVTAELDWTPTLHFPF